MEGFSDCLSIVVMMMMMLCLEMAVGQEQTIRPLLSYEQDLSTTIKPENDHAEPLTSTTTNNTITKASTTTRKKKELKKKKRADSYHNWGI